MSSSELHSTGMGSRLRARDALLVAAFVGTAFVSAALLFVVEPMFTKIVVPRFGGAAAVWSVAMVFFQATLLAGYAYAHLLTRFVPGKTSFVLHLIVLALACTALPLHIAEGWGRPPQTGEAIWLLGLFTVSIGLPFFALAASAPLLQAWFARSAHIDAKDPYFIYAASNAGSFLALISYPLLIEPAARLTDQTQLWSIGFYGLLLLMAGCALLVQRSPAAALEPKFGAQAAAVDAPSWANIVPWIALSAVPSGLLIAVTAHVATDVAAIPLLWVMPLALYLLTFVIAFQRRPVIPHRHVIEAQPIFVLLLIAIMIINPIGSTPIVLGTHLFAFFVCALLCHGELARRRPAALHLTSYFMWISVGGTLGGIATGLVAPAIFSGIAEYPLLLVLAMLCRPGTAAPARMSTRDLMLYSALGLAMLSLIAMRWLDISPEASVIAVSLGVVIGLSISYWRAPLPFAAIIAFLLIGSHVSAPNYSIHKVRNFFGVLSVTESADGRFRSLWHGTTGQGAQRILDDDENPTRGRPEMISEFFAGGGIAQVFDAVRARVVGPMTFAVIGLGTGTLACQVQAGDKLTFYELDPDIARIARDPNYFSYVSECAPNVPIVLGDARLTLTDAADASYDLIFIDAFLGASIPVHLLTREAIDLYFRKLKPNGVVAMHISNRNLELSAVVASIAARNGLVMRLYDGGDVQEDASEIKWVARVAALARKDDDFGVLAQSNFWPPRKGDPSQRPWTDDYSNVVGAIMAKLRE